MSTTGRLAALASIGLAAIVAPALAADVTSERLLNAPNEPENWLMVHRDYNNSRHSPLTQINTTTAKDLKPKFIFSIGGRATGGTLRGKEESTPLVDDGFMYVADTWTRVTKFDVRSGDAAVPLWRYDPKIKQSRTNRGIAMYGNKILVSTNDMRMIALNRDSGEVIWEVDAKAPTDPATGTPSPKTQGFTGAPVKPWVLGDGVPVAGSVGALASTSQITSPESRLSAIMRMSLVETRILFPYIAMPRLVRDCLILGSYRHNGTAASPLRTSNFVTRVQVSATYMKPSSTRGVDSSLPRSVPPVARPPIEKMNFGLRSFAVVVLICVSGEWRELL